MRWVLPIIVIFAGCSDPDPVQDVLGVSVPMAWSAALATAAVEGDQASCVLLADGCTGDACFAAMEIDLSDAACPFPFEGNATGTITVGGTWIDDSVAGMAFGFDEARIDGRRLRADSVEGAVVTVEDGDPREVLVTWAWEMVGIDADTSDVDVEQDGWVTTLEDPGTPADPSDDTIEVIGASQHIIDTVNIRDVVLGPAIRFEPTCRRNPVDGEAMIIQIGLDSSGGDSYSFHDECDGTMDRLGGVFGASVELELTR